MKIESILDYGSVGVLIIGCFFALKALWESNETKDKAQDTDKDNHIKSLKEQIQAERERSDKEREKQEARRDVERRELLDGMNKGFSGFTTILENIQRQLEAQQEAIKELERDVTRMKIKDELTPFDIRKEV